MIAVQLFQQQNGLTPDGVIGPKTIAMMLHVWGISKTQLAHFLGQTHEETGGFEALSENLNYSADALVKLFGKHFNNDADKYARQPEKIANRIYANRMGNGNEASGEGWKFRGRGCLQTTGRNNYTLLGKYLNADLINNPDLVATKYPFESALFYFNSNKLWNLCNEVTEDSIKRVTKAVNGGYINLDKRIELTKKYQLLIK
jgi:putative chitinase